MVTPPRWKQLWQPLVVIGFLLFVAAAAAIGDARGIQAGQAFGQVLLQMVQILPCAFLLIALFEVWVKRETVVAHLGTGSGPLGYFWAILLGGMTIGGMYVAFPVAHTLFRKGASLRIIFCFLGFAGVCRIPMTVFEIACLGWRFTLLRLSSAVLLWLLAGVLIGGYLEKRGYEIVEM